MLERTLVQCVIDDDHLITPWNPYQRKFRGFFIPLEKAAKGQDSARIRKLRDGPYKNLQLLVARGAQELLAAASASFSVTLVTTADTAFAKAAHAALQCAQEVAAVGLGNDGRPARDLNRLLAEFGCAEGKRLPCVCDSMSDLWPRDQQRYMLPSGGDARIDQLRDLSDTAPIVERLAVAIEGAGADDAVHDLLRKAVRQR